MQFAVQVCVPSGFVVYLQKLMDAGVVVPGTDGSTKLDAGLLAKLREAHKDLAAGDATIQAELDAALDAALGAGNMVASI